MRSFVELADGRRLRLADLPVRVPRSCFAGETHLEVCERWAAQSYVDPRWRDTFLNLLFVKSDRMKQITSLRVLIRSGALDVRRVRSRFIGPEYADWIGPDVELDLQRRQTNAVRTVFFVRFALKAAVHRIYRLLGKRGRARSRPSTVVRAWVDTTDATYPEYVRSEALYVYPFSTNWLRQLRYLRRCARESRRFHLAGLPYRMSDVAGMVAGWSKRDEMLARGEEHANRAHGRELVAEGVERVWTGDEFEMAGHALHAELLAGGVQTTNTTHGVGVYGPCVRYGHFSFYNAQQRVFYERRSRWDSADCRDHTPKIRRPEPSASGYAPVVVYIQGNWAQRRASYESRLEDQVIRELGAACRSVDLPLLVKPHPNLHALTRARQRLRYGVEQFDDLPSLGLRHPVFINLLSTTYYACLALGPTVFVSDDLVDPGTFFGPGLHTARTNELRDALVRFADAGHWSECYKRCLETALDSPATLRDQEAHEGAHQAPQDRGR